MNPNPFISSPSKTKESNFTFWKVILLSLHLLCWVVLDVVTT